MKAHLLDSEDPLIEGEDYRALCGDEISNSVFVYMFDTDAAEEFLSALSAVNTCRKCCTAGLDKRYVYGIVSGQELMTQESEP